MTPLQLWMHATYEVARKEVTQHVRTKRLLIVGLLFILTLVFLTVILPVSILGIDELRFQAEGIPLENYVFLFYLSTFFIGGYFFIQLLSIVLTADAVCSEWQNRTIFLLLSKPVSRTAFVTGKFLGSLVTVIGTIGTAFILDYLLLQALLPGSPSAGYFWAFFGALGVLVLGAAAFAALSLFLSTITKSTVMSLLLALALWIFVLPLVAQIGFFTTLGDDDFQGDFDSARVDWSRYLSPGTSMAVASKILVQEENVGDLLDFLIGTPANTPLAILALCGHIALYFGLALLVVKRRNFE